MTVVSPEEPDGPELLLEPNDNAAANTYQKAIYEQGIAAASFAVEDVEMEYQRLKALGVAFTTKPAQAGAATISVFR